ncbi:glycoside hydrolase N-terminal domain-containing protein [Paenibacillus sp. NPDC058174]|uniref:glycoside hydrolase family 95 protein n=1 Tax=Paenibacillus sp. NPDC058174 TaxID=3346366 RepID=UPI0036DC71E1
MNDILWYKTPATNLHESLPVGNGRIGAMVFGGVYNEIIQIDESTFWSGSASENDDREGMQELSDQLRKLLLAGEYDEADRLGHHFIGNKGNYGTSLPIGHLHINLAGSLTQTNRIFSDYRRQLNFRSGLAITEFTLAGTLHTRETFVSNPAGIFVTRYYANGAVFDLEICLEGIENNVKITGFSGDNYTISGDAFEELHSDGKTGVHLTGSIRLKSDGLLKFNDRASVTAATYVEIYLDMATTMFTATPETECKARLNAAYAMGYETLKTQHIADHTSLYSRMEFHLEDEDLSYLTTDNRLKRLVDGSRDLGLISTLFNYGRYLLIASSREDSPLPTHMGGIWNDNIYARADCAQDMHIDMNLQMQYWLANPCNLSECSTPVFRWLRDIVVPKGRVTADKTYGANGFVAHVVSNAWGYTALGWSYNWGVWAFGGLWTATLLWEHYRYTQDEKFLKEDAFPILFEAARFASDYLFYDEKSGYAMSGPAYSPENHFIYDGKAYCLSVSNTCDILMIREIFNIVLQAAPLVDDQENPIDHDVLLKIQDQLIKLPPYRVGKNGQIQEWYSDFEEADSGHRHTSHLLGLYPFQQIIPERDLELAQAIHVTLQRRYADCELSSWTMAFFISYYARLLDGENAYEMLLNTFNRTVEPNLTSTMGKALEMWGNTWELDGNTGLTSAICEMLLQTIPAEDGDTDTLLLLPALPSAWDNGHVHGICAAGGFEVSMEWQDGQLTKVKLRANSARHIRVRYGENCCLLTTEAGGYYIGGPTLVFGN